MYIVINFNQEAWLTPYIVMKTELRKLSRKNLEKNNAVLGKTKGNTREHRDLMLIKTKRREISLASESNLHTTNFFSNNLLAVEAKKARLLLSNSVYLRLSILKISKIVMHKF